MSDLFSMPIQNDGGRRSRNAALDGPFVWTPTVEDKRTAQSNHSQTLERLKDRGGMSWCEMLAILNHRTWYAVADQAKAKAACEANVSRRSDVTSTKNGGAA